MVMITRRQLLACAACAPFVNIATGVKPDQRVRRVRPRRRMWRDGTLMWAGGYADSAYMVALPGGGLVSTLTVSSGVEGSTDQHSIILSSVDRGASWAKVAELEPATGPEASWAMPWLHPGGRLYAFYTYNADDVRRVPASAGPGFTDRADSVGVLAYRSSVDGGATWSQRATLDVPETAIDRRNPFAGLHRLFWLSGVPVTHGNSGYFGMSKMGVFPRGGTMFSDTEGYVVKVTETSAGVLGCTVSAPIINRPVAEEPAPLVHADGLLTVTYRTTAGRLGQAVSRDDGATWRNGWAHDTHRAIIHQPRAKAAQFDLGDGRILLWGHDNSEVPGGHLSGASFTGPRNPVHYRIGRRARGTVVWSRPRVLLADPDRSTRISYPSVVVDGPDILVSATDKQAARVHRIPLEEL